MGATGRIPLHLLSSASMPTPFARAFSTSRPSAFSSSARAHNRASDHSDDEPPAHLTHIDPSTGKASMVSVSSKPSTVRTATAQGEIYLGARAFSLIDLGNLGDKGCGGGGTGRATLATKKGDVLSIAELAGLMGAKHTALLIPLCHPLSLSHVRVSLRPLRGRDALRIECEAQCVGPTGVEMEALTGVSVAALTVWDMCKAVAGQEMRIENVRVVSKSGGRSGDWVREEGEAEWSSGE
ncbi:cyclic pyranopterin monophosphate synthase [Rhodotorula paludigena]|uniref:cyclic pyranopterin monophosphate synthase n=1 Tax=Rhodotorula paludigena TaxID=86838 RepID=UPI0031756E0B